MIAKLFRKVLHVYPGEGKRAILFCILAFFWAVAVTTANKFSEASFLLHVGPESLPTAYIFTAGALLSGASVLIYAFQRFTPGKVFLFVTGFVILYYITFFSILISEVGEEAYLIWFVIKVLSYFSYMIIITCFWLFIDEYYHIQDAKRFFSVFSTAIFCGLIITGGVIGSGIFSLAGLMVLVVSFLLISMGLTIYIDQTIEPVLDESVILEMHGRSEHGGVFKMLKTVFTSRFTLLIMAGNFLVLLLSVITEYNYMATFSERFSEPGLIDVGMETSAKLTQFLGRCLGGVSVVNIILGLIIFPRFLRRFGMNRAFMFTPVILLITFSGWLSTDVLLFPLLGFFVVEGSLYVVDDSNFSIALNAVPQKVKRPVRVIVESFFEPIGMLCSGILLEFFLDYSLILGFILSGVALVVTFYLGKNFLPAIYRNLREDALSLHHHASYWMSNLTGNEWKKTQAKLLGSLRSSRETDALFSAEALIASGNQTSLAKLLSVADSFSESGKLKLLHIFRKYSLLKSDQVIKCIKKWATRPHEASLRSEIHFALASVGRLGIGQCLDDLDQENPLFTAAGVVGLRKTVTFESAMSAAYHRTLAEQHLERLLEDEGERELIAGMRALGEIGGDRAQEVLLHNMNNFSLPLMRQAAESFTAVIDKQGIRHVETLLQLMTRSNDRTFRKSCLESIQKVADTSVVTSILEESEHFRPYELRITEGMLRKMGLRSVPVLLSVLKNRKFPNRGRMLSGKVLGSIAPPQLHAALYDVIQSEIDRAYLYFYHAHELQNSHPDLDLKELVSVLQFSFQSVIDFIVHLLSAAGAIEDSDLMIRSLRSQNPKVRGQAVEMLEKSCDPKIFRLLDPLVSDLPPEEKVKTYLRLGYVPLSLSALLDRMVESSEYTEQMVAVMMMQRLDMPEWQSTLEALLKEGDETLHHFGFEILERASA